MLYVYMLHTLPWMDSERRCWYITVIMKQAVQCSSPPFPLRHLLLETTTIRGVFTHFLLIFVIIHHYFSIWGLSYFFDWRITASAAFGFSNGFYRFQKPMVCTDGYSLSLHGELGDWTGSVFCTRGADRRVFRWKYCSRLGLGCVTAHIRESSYYY